MGEGADGMDWRKQLWFWSIALAVLILVLYVLGDVLLPFVAGIALAYLLDPLASRLERLGLSRLWATILVIVAVLSAFILSLMLLAPILSDQLAAFAQRLPEYAGRLQELARERGAPLLERLGAAQGGEAQRQLGDFASQAVAWIGRVAQSALAGGRAIANFVSLLVITPVVAFYMLLDWDRMIATVDGWLPRDHRDTLRRLGREMDGAIAGFVRGQSLVCLLLGTYYAVGLGLMGLNFGILIGMISGLLTFIPYVGSFVGLILAVGVAIVQFWPDWKMPLIALAIFASGQFLEGNFLSPKLVGDAVGLHPVWLMFALVAFGSLFGFVGLLLAVPLAAVVGVLARFALRRYLDSPLYAGTGSRPPEG